MVPYPEVLVSVKEATLQLKTPTSSISLKPTTVIGSLSGDILETVVCEAVVSLFGEDIISEAEHEGWPHRYTMVEDFGSEGWKLLTACKLGDVGLLRSCYTSFNAQNLPHGPHNHILRSCLSTAIKEGWDIAFHHLLGVGMELESTDSIRSLETHPIFAAAWYGQTNYLRALLDAHSFVETSQSLFESYVIQAAKHPNQSCRAEMVDMLLSYGKYGTNDEPRQYYGFRHQVLFLACRMNDAALASRMLEYGYIDLYIKHRDFRPHVRLQSAFRAVVESKSIDCLKLFLTIAPPEQAHEEAEAMSQLRIAFGFATHNQNLEMVKVLLPHLQMMTFEEKYKLAARVEGGITALQEVCGAEKVSASGPVPISSTDRVIERAYDHAR